MRVSSVRIVDQTKSHLPSQDMRLPDPQWEILKELPTQRKRMYSLR